MPGDSCCVEGLSQEETLHFTCLDITGFDTILLAAGTVHDFENHEPVRRFVEIHVIIHGDSLYFLAVRAVPKLPSGLGRGTELAPASVVGTLSRPRPLRPAPCGPVSVTLDIVSR